MPEINANFTVESFDITVVQDSNEINVTTEPIALNYYIGAPPSPVGNSGEIQFNNLGSLAGAINTDCTNGNVRFTNIANLKINGGNSGFYLQTDGSGTLTWAPGTANVTPGNGSPSGANNQIQLSNGAGGFKDAAGFNFDSASNTLAVPGVVSATGNIISGNASLGNLATANFLGGTLITAAQPNITSLGPLSTLLVLGNATTGNFQTGILTATGNLTAPNISSTGIINATGNITGGNIIGNANVTGGNLISNALTLTANLTVNTNINTSNLTVNNISNLGNIGNVKITGGNSGQFISTDGNGNLNFTTPLASWSNVANISVGDLVFGIAYNTPAISPGANFVTNNIINFSNWTLVNANDGNAIGANAVGRDFSYDSNNKTLYSLQVANASGNVFLLSENGIDWTRKNTSILPHKAPIRCGNNIVIFATNTNLSAYSNNFGNSWTNVNLPSSRQWQDIASDGSNNIVIVQRAITGNTVIAKSHDGGLTYSQVQLSAFPESIDAVAYGNGAFIAMQRSTNFFYKSTNNGNTWSTVTVSANRNWSDITFGNNTFVSVAENSNIATYSTDNGNTWSNSTMSSNTYWYSVFFANGTFVAPTAFTTNLAYTSNLANTWTAANTNMNPNSESGVGGYIPYLDTLVIGGFNPASGNLSITGMPKIITTSSDGNISNSVAANTGTYKLLGASLGNVGATWVKIL